MKMAQEKWEKKWVEALMLLPSYIVFAILITKLSLIYWILLVLFAQYFFGKLYDFAILNKNFLRGRFSRERAAAIFFILQCFALGVIMFLGSV